MVERTSRRAALAAYAALTITALLWAGNWIIGRSFAGDIAPFTLTFWRWAVALAVLLPFTLARIQRQRGAIVAEWRRLVIFALLSITIVHAMVYYGLARTTAINGALFSSISPVFVIMISWAWFGLGARYREIFGVAVSLCGVVTIIARGSPAIILELSFGGGDLIILASLFLWALYTVLLKQWPSALDGLSFITVVAVIGWIFLLPFYLIERVYVGDPHFSSGLIAAILYVGICASALAFTGWNYGVQVIGAARTSLFQHLVPVFAGFLAIFLLGETLQFYHLAGFALILTGLAAANIRAE